MRNKCVQETQDIPYCCNPLTVAEENKLRLVLDLRHINKYVKQQKFKYENLATVAEMFEQGFYFGTFDLKSGYHHVPIAKQDQQYLIIIYNIFRRYKKKLYMVIFTRSFFSFSICLDVPHLTNEHRTQDCIAS